MCDKDEKEAGICLFFLKKPPRSLPRVTAKDQDFESHKSFFAYNLPRLKFQLQIDGKASSQNESKQNKKMLHLEWRNLKFAFNTILLITYLGRVEKICHCTFDVSR